MLTIPIKRKWFKMIVSGEKQEEYREIKPYWDLRLRKDYPFLIRIKNGYGKSAPFADLKVEKTVGFGRLEWGAPSNKKVYILRIIDVLRIEDKE